MGEKLYPAARHRSHAALWDGTRTLHRSSGASALMCAFYPRGAVIAGRFTVERSLGEGAFGGVYDAWDAHLARRVAVKVLLHTSRFQRKRFMIEAQALARVDHECVVQIFDRIDDDNDDATPCLIMQLVRGCSFEERLGMRPRGQAPLDEAATVVTRALSGLAAIHRAGVVHRDLKPANLMLGESASHDNVKIVDLGLACEGSDSAGGATVDPRQPALHDSSVGFVGTCFYAAPEQVLPPYRAGRTADIFAMGVIAYRALSGTFPYPAASQREYVEVMRGVSLPVPLRDRVSRLDDRVVATIERALHRDPSERFQSAEAFHEALTEALRASGATSPGGAVWATTATSNDASVIFRGPRELGLPMRRIPARPPPTGSSAMHPIGEPIYVAVHPTTVEAFARFVQETGYVTDAERNARAQTWRRPGFDQGDQHPVVCVSLRDAQRYCDWAGLRLPSEPEWCAAAFGLDGRTYPWGDGPPTEERLWWSRGAVRSGTAPIGARPLGATPSLHFDMAGNIWEWTSSPCAPSRGHRTSSPLGLEERVICGGGWRDRDPRAITRDGLNQCHPSSSDNDLGFRCSLGSEEP